MAEKTKKFSLLCPFCKEVIAFELKEKELEKRYKGGLAGILIPSHGNPAHSLEVYIDKGGLIRGAYPKIEDLKIRDDLQNYYIIDATCEITPNEGKVLGVDVLPFTISIENGPLKRYNEEIFFTEIYRNLKQDKSVKSQPVSIEDFLNAYKRAPKGKPIIVLVVSKRYSQGYNSAVMAKLSLEKEDPERAKNIHIIDSKTTGPLLKLMMNKTVKMDEQGKSLEEILDYLNWVRTKHVSYIYVDSLDALRKSERVGRVTTFFGNLFGLKPVIIENENNNGDLKAFKTVRSKDESIREITKAIKEQFKDQELVGVIFYGINIEDAKKLQKTLDASTGILHEDFTLDFIGSGVAIHLSYDILGISLFPKP